MPRQAPPLEQGRNNTHMRMRAVLFLSIALALFGAPEAYAQEIIQDTVTFVKAEVTEVISQEEKEILGTGTPATYQTIEVRILEGADAGKIITLDNDYLMLKEGEVVYLRHTVNAFEGKNTYAVSEPYRLPILWFFVALFLLCLFIFGGKQGLRGLLALIASLFCIAYLLLPGILAGYSPILLSVGISSLIVIVGSYITHGFNRTTTAAVFGMLAAIVITGLLAYIAITWGRLSGYTEDEAVYLNFNTGGAIDFVGLLLGGIMIGLLGVLYDAAISQAIAVEELFAAGKNISKREVFARALRIGREHIGALVNTLAIAYVGASLPLLLLLKQVASSNISTTINQEVFATEILRTAISSIGLILAVPLTTFVAVWMLSRPKKEKTPLPNGGERHSHTH
jgi:uncharacterized membrane protein